MEDTKQEFTDVSGYHWKELVEEFGYNYNFFLALYKIRPEMLQEGGLERDYEDKGKKIKGQGIIFDRSYIVEKLAMEFLHTGLNKEGMEKLNKEVMDNALNKADQAYRDKIERINKLAKELGVDPEEMPEKLKV